jgi:hypothetical protein
LAAGHASDDVKLVADVVGVGLGEKCGPRRAAISAWPLGTWANTGCNVAR